MIDLSFYAKITLFFLLGSYKSYKLQLFCIYSLINAEFCLILLQNWVWVIFNECLGINYID